MSAARTPKAAKKGKRGRKPPPENETRREAFLRIGNARTVNALDAIRLIGNLARGAYDWTMEDVAVIVKAIEKQSDMMVEEFKAAIEPAKKDIVEFSLTDHN